MRAFGNKVLIDPEIELKTEGGILIPQMGLTTMAPVRGTVVSAGSLCEELSDGDFVHFEKGKGLDILDEETGRNLLVMREADVQAILQTQ